MSLSSQVGLLATRIGTEIKSIRNSFVPNAQRGPIGGVNQATGVQGTVNLDPALSNHRRLAATADLTIAAMGTGVDGQRMLLEINGSGGQRIVSFDSSYELSGSVTTRTFTVPSGGWAYIALIYRASTSTWRLTSADPQPTPDYAPPSIWLPADHGLIAWNGDPTFATATFGGATTFTLHCAIKVSTTAVCSQVNYAISTAGSGLTSGRNAIGLYNAAGTLIAQTADLSSVWTSTGNKVTAWSNSVTVNPGTYFAMFLCNASASTPAFTAIPGPQTFLTGRSQAAWRGAYISPSSLTALPSTRPTPNAFGTHAWVGLS